MKGRELAMTHSVVCTNCGYRHFSYTEVELQGWLETALKVVLVDACGACYPRPVRVRGPVEAPPSQVSAANDSDW